ncbi:MAG: hypothetical protein IH971_01505 [Candidatus Marinimicrobia bacterium]|nr:hypothetical protein [Candidatus Neomarinimicrobiota bacterium]
MQPKRWWEILATLTPLIIGLGVTGLGTFATFVYRTQEIQLTQLKVLNEWRSMLQSDNAQDRSFAYNAFVALGYESLVRKLVLANNDPAGRPALATAAKDDGSNEAKRILAEVPVYVFIHIAQEEDREKAEILSDSLVSRLKFIVPGVQLLKTAPQEPEVRYFNDVDKEEATEVAKLMMAVGWPDAKVKRVSFLKAKPGTVEVWLPASDA